MAFGDTPKSTTTNKPESKSTKTASSNSAKTKDRDQEAKKNTGDHTKIKSGSKSFEKDSKDNAKIKNKSKVHVNNAANDKKTKTGKKNYPIRTPFDTALEKLSKCANDSPSLVDVMQENLRELQTDKKYVPLFNAAPHTAAYLNRRIHDSTKFINGLRQALNADWSNPTWKSWDEIDTLFRPFKQQFVYAMMRFNCT